MNSQNTNGELKRSLIKKHLENWNGAAMLSVASYSGTGRISGTLLTAINNMMDEYLTATVQELQRENERLKDELNKCERRWMLNQV